MKNQTHHLSANKDIKECGLEVQSNGLLSTAPQNETDSPINRQCCVASGFPIGGGSILEMYNLGSRTDYRLFAGKTAPREKARRMGWATALVPFLLQTPQSKCVSQSDEEA